MKQFLTTSILLIASFLGYSQTPIQSYSWKNVTINGGGYVPGFVYSKASKNLLYARTDVGGAYRWDNTNKKWIPLSDFVTSGNQLGVISMAADPTDSNRVYMATGLYTNSWDPNGVFYSSTDRGTTWTRSELPCKVGGNEAGRGTGERLQVDPNLPNKLLFASQEQGLFQSLDYGMTWTKVTSFPKINCTFLEIDPSSGTKGTASKDIYIGTYDHLAISDTTVGGLYRSVDAGANWSYWAGQFAKVEPKDFDRPRISTSAIPNNLVFAGNNIFITMSNNLAPGTSNGYVVRFNKTNNTWTKIYPFSRNTQGGYNSLSVHPTNPNIVVVGTLGYWWPTSDRIYVTTNGGTTWTDVRTKMKTDTKNTPHGGGMGWNSGLKINPFNPSQAIFGSGNGLWMTNNLDKAFTNDSTLWVYENDNFEETVPLALASPPSGAELISGLGDIKGFVHLDLTKSPADNYHHHGNTYSVDFAENDPKIIVRAHDGGKRASISRNNGVTWTDFAAQAIGGDTRTNFVSISPNGINIVWSPSDSFSSVSSNDGASWALCAGLGENVYPKSDRVNSNIFYAIDNATGAFFRSTDGAKSFVNTPTTFSFSGGMNIVPVFGREGHVWLSAGTNGLHYTTNGGTSFTKITTVEEAYRVTFGKAAAGANYPSVFIYGKVNGSVGLFRSDNTGATWIKINTKNQEFGRGFTRGIAGDPKKYGRLYIGTDGRGILYGDVQGTGLCHEANLEEGLTICRQSLVPLNSHIPTSGYVYSWFKDGIAQNSDSSKLMISEPGNYKVIASKSGCPTTSDNVDVSSKLLKVNKIELCPRDSVVMTVSKIGTYAWYNSSMQVLDTTNQRFSFRATTKTTIYVKDIAKTSNIVGLPSYTTGGWGIGGAFTSAQNIGTLNVIDDIRLRGISLRVNSNGTNGVIRILDKDGKIVAIGSRSNLVVGMQEIPFNVLLPIGIYTIDAVGTTGSIQFQTDRTNAVFSIPDFLTYNPVGWGYGLFFNIKIEITDNCAVTPIDVKVEQPPATISTTTPTTFCQGGSVVLTASAGSSYIWRNGNTTLSTTAQTHTANAAGAYTVEVTNANGCKATSAATTVTVNPLPTATISTTTPTTFCQGGSVVLTASAGSSYIWRNGNTTLSTTAQTPTANAAGTYTVEVTNANGCKATSTATTVTVNALPTATISTTTPITFCQGGSVVLTASAGTSYIWRNGNTTLSTTTQTHTANAAGTYTVEVTNANGCKATSTATTVTVNPLPTATISTTTPSTFCQGGSVVLTASAGTSYIWRNGNTTLTTTAQTHTANAAGTYTVEVTNANGCKATSSATTVTVNPLPTATISTTTPTTFCQGGSVVLTASAGTSYIWRNGNTTLSTTAQTHTANAAGTYTVEVTNANGCKATSAATTVTVNPLPTATISTTTPTTFCQGGSVVLTASAGSSYIWRNGNTTLSTTAQTHTANAAGTYTVEVTNANGCKATSSATTVTVNPLPTATISTTTPITFCQGGSVVLTASAGTSYIWRNGNTTLSTTAQAHTANAAGTYTVEVTNANGCKATSTATPVEVQIPTTWYADADNDGWGDINTTKVECTQPVGYVSISGDNCPSISNPSQTNTDGDAQGDACDTDDDNDGIADANDCAPLDKNIGLAITWYADADNDGLGDINTTKVECTQPVGYVSTSGDNCPNDLNKTNPGNCGCGNTENSCLDCFGTPNGTAFLDDCKVCVGGLTQKEACTKDCHGDFGGTAFVDSCGKCAGGNTGLVAIRDKDRCITGIQVGTNNQLVVIPNPFNNQLEINLSNFTEFKVLDANGKVLTQGVESIKLNTSGFAAGVYVVLLSSQTTTQMIKVVKQ